MSAMRQLHHIASLRQVISVPTPRVFTAAVIKTPPTTTTTTKTSAPHTHQSQSQQRRRNYTSAVGETKFDQTKESNDPSKDVKSDHRAAAEQTADDGSSRDSDHPAKRPDPQESPSKPTGVETEGPGGSKAGEGKEPSNVQQKQRDKDILKTVGRPK
ncbi:hypothetical protein F5Y17DRAFT_414225 [Xylariaceae sp. FL0594]|nr:hypothetical protein F5Y17DRAFT_414225 [Xylariaceae sp. FL0594]